MWAVCCYTRNRMFAIGVVVVVDAHDYACSTFLDAGSNRHRHRYHTDYPDTHPAADYRHSPGYNALL